jgi:2-methylisocitrate lyase-like PEP mutase family enzyme
MTSTDAREGGAPISIAEAFLAMHVAGAPLLIPNPWDVGSARLLAWLGFKALATTSSGSAMTFGQLDGSLSRDQALSHAATIVDAVGIPVSADLENCFSDDSVQAAETVRAATSVGLAGCSIEDWDGEQIYPYDVAVERVRAAAAAARKEPRIILTARAENYLHGREDLADTIKRLQAYQEAGADVLYAPGVTDLAQLRTLVNSVERPVNVLAMPSTPPVAQLADIGVARVSVGGAFAFAAAGALISAATELRDSGTYSYTKLSADGRAAIRAAFGAAETR